MARWDSRLYGVVDCCEKISRQKECDFSRRGVFSRSVAKRYRGRSTCRGVIAD